MADPHRPGNAAPSAPSAPARAPEMLGPLLLALFLAVAMGAYAFSILDAARRVTDWLLIAPVALIGIICLGVAAHDDWRRARAARAAAAAAQAPAPQEHAPQQEATPGDARIGAALVVLVLAYAGSIPWLGFDLATALFVALALVLQGERRAHVVAPMALLTAGLLVWIFKHLMGVPLPSTLI